MTPRRQTQAPAVGLPAGPSWTLGDAVGLGRAHITSIAEDHPVGPTAVSGDLLATSHASRRDTTQALTLLLGTLGILLGMALLVGTPIASIR